MQTKERNLKKVEFQLDDGGVIARRKTGFLPDGAYFFEDELQIKGFLTTTVVIGASWLLELCDFTEGEFFFVRDDTEVRPQTNCFGVLYTPFSISQPGFRNAKGHVVGVAGNAALPAEFSLPILFDTTFRKRPSGSSQVVEILRSGKCRQSVELNSTPSLLPLRAKKLIDENYLANPSIARIAGRLGVTHAHLSRQFKKDFGMSPSAYLHQQRVADASQRLARGEEIINISQDVGYNDLSRFYKQFRKRTKTSPGVCRTMVKST